MREEQEFRDWLAEHHPNVRLCEYGDVVQLCVKGQHGLSIPVEITQFSIRALHFLDGVGAHLKRTTEKVRALECLHEGVWVDKRTTEICFENETEHLVKLVFKMKEVN